MRKRFKRLIISMLCIMTLMTTQVFAHRGDVYDGVYMSNSPYSQNPLKLLIDTSAITEALTMTMYREALEWNNISSNVEVSVTQFHLGMSDAGFTYIRGASWTDGMTGLTEARDQNGYICGANDDWYSVTIYINTHEDAFSGSSYPEKSAIKTIIHEVGHALKLAHPFPDESYADHIYDGLPHAVMNQGLVDEACVAFTVVTHDKKNLIYKWGGEYEE